MKLRSVCIISGIMTLLAILPTWPYAYYEILRWVVFISSIIISYNFYKSKLQGWTLAFGAIAIIFNPIIPVFLYQKSFWTGIDLVTGLLFLIASGATKKTNK